MWKGQKDASPLKVRSFSMTKKITTVCGPKRMYCTSLHPNARCMRRCMALHCLPELSLQNVLAMYQQQNQQQSLKPEEIWVVARTATYRQKLLL